MQAIISDALQLELGSKLQSFETEYEVMDELRATFEVHQDITDIESMNETLKKQNKELIEHLAICHGSIKSLESMVQGLQHELKAQTQRIEM